MYLFLLECNCSHYNDPSFWSKLMTVQIMSVKINMTSSEKKVPFTKKILKA